jgi:NAD(P)-dependent dehydrogenase (short-subunit alcohol dehydrogenase family)
MARSIEEQSMNLSGKTAFITGAARGIGAEVARVLASRGVRVALAGLEPERLAAVANELGPAHVWSECDVTDDASLAFAVAKAVDALGGIDIVVANAGIAAHGTIAVTPMAAMRRVVDVNLTGVIGTVSATLPHVVARRGYYLLVSSAASLAATPGFAVYSATKSGVEQFGNGLRLELAHQGVDVGTAHPCWIDTDMVRDARNELASFRILIRSLPGPFGTVTSVEACARGLVEGIERRKRKVFVPKSLAPFAALRQLIMSPAGEFFLRRNAKKVVPKLEAEVRAMGRVFGEHSVERDRGPGPGAQLGVGPKG